MFIIKLVADAIARTAKLRRKRRARASSARGGQATTSQSQGVNQEVNENNENANNPDAHESSEEESYLDLGADNGLLYRIRYRNPKEHVITNVTDSILYNLVSGREDMTTACMRSQLVQLPAEEPNSEDEPILAFRRRRRRKPRNPLRRTGGDTLTVSGVEPAPGTSSSSTELMQSTIVDDLVPSTSYEQSAQYANPSPVNIEDVNFQIFHRKRHRHSLGCDNGAKLFICDSVVGSQASGNREEPLDLSSASQIKIKSAHSEYPLLEHELFSVEDTNERRTTLRKIPIEPSTSTTDKCTKRQPYNFQHNVMQNNGLSNEPRQTISVGNPFNVTSIGNNVHDFSTMWNFLLTPIGMATAILTMMANKSGLIRENIPSQTLSNFGSIMQSSEKQVPLFSLMSRPPIQNAQVFSSSLSANNMVVNEAQTTHSFNPMEPTWSNTSDKHSLMDTISKQITTVGQVSNAHSSSFAFGPRVGHQESRFKLLQQKLSPWEMINQEASQNGVLDIRTSNGRRYAPKDCQSLEKEQNNTHATLTNGHKAHQSPSHINANSNLTVTDTPLVGSSSDVTEETKTIAPVDYAINKVQSYLFALTELVIQPTESLTSDLRQWKRSERDSVPQATVRTFATLMLQLIEVPLLNRFNLLKISWHRLLILYLQEDDKVCAWFRASTSNAWHFEGDKMKAAIEQLEEVHNLSLSLKKNPFFFQMLRVGLLLLGEKREYSGDPIVRQMEDTLYQDSMEQIDHSPTAGVIPQVLVTAQRQLRELVRFRTCLTLLGNLDQETTGQIFRVVFKQPITMFSKVLMDLK